MHVKTIHMYMACILTLNSVSDTSKHIWQIIYHFIAFFDLNLGVILSSALITPAACIIKIFSKLKVMIS